MSAIPFIRALQDIIRADEPAPVRKPYSCNACLDTGETESGGSCRWCALGDQWDGKIYGETDSD
jgi:hypothetical protein